MWRLCTDTSPKRPQFLFLFCHLPLPTRRWEGRERPWTGNTKISLSTMHWISGKACAQKHKQDLSKCSSDLGTGDKATKQRKLTGSTYTKKKKKPHRTHITQLFMTAIQIAPSASPLGKKINKHKTKCQLCNLLARCLSSIDALPNIWKAISKNSCFSGTIVLSKTTF